MWDLVIPFKSLDIAKSRLRGSVEGCDLLALAFATDVLDAVSRTKKVERVFVVTSDTKIRATAKEFGARTVEDTAHTLNGAIALGVQQAAGKTAVLLGDLPALTPGDLDSALNLASKFPLAMVPDYEGTGTTLLTSTAKATLTPKFGTGSRERHELSGHRIIDLDDSSSLRRDVDTVENLQAALSLGCGTATTSHTFNLRF